MELSADRVVLVSALTPEHLAALFVLAIALVAALVSAVMARRGRVEGWSLVGVFCLIALATLFALAHMPTRLAFDRTGAAVAYGPFEDRKAWSELASVDAERLWGGLRIRFLRRAPGRSLLPWSAWPGLFVPAVALEPRDLTMRIEAWRLSAK